MKKYYTLLVSLVVFFFTFRLVASYSDYFDGVEDAYRQRSAVNLSSDVKAEDISHVLLLHGYVRDTADARLIGRTLADSLHNRIILSSIYDLQKQLWQLPSEVVEREGGVSLKTRLTASCRALGHEQLDTLKNLVSVESKHDFKAGTGRIAVEVGQEGKSVQGVPVRLQRHIIDSVGNPVTEVMLYATTDANGSVLFENLDTSLSYSVLPVKRGFEYGTSHGTTGGSLGSTERETHGLKKFFAIFSSHKGDLHFSFEQKEHRVRLFDDATLRRFREDHSLTLRTPAEWKGMLIRGVCFFLAVWWLFVLVLWLRRRGDAPFAPAAAIMALSGLCLLGMFSFNDPLEDMLYGGEMLQGIVVGVVLMGALQFFNVKKFFQDGYRIKFDPLLSSRGMKGWGWLAAALLLTLLLLTPLAHSVGGMSVNLQLGPLKFQPSEIAKYLIVIFMTAWFVRNIDTVVNYSEAGNAHLFWHKCRFLAALMGGLLLLLLLYMVLGDMGPGMVLVFTFILMYSIVKSKVALTAEGGIDWGGVLKSDVVMLLVGVASFLLMLWIGGRFGLQGVAALIWLAGWMLYWYLRRREVRESAVMANAVIAVFVFAKDILRGTGVGDRLAMRSEMCSNTWGELGLTGADMAATSNSQVAEGLWGLASGGFFGQGLGKGEPNWIPAFHTDMVLESFGEQLGLIGLLAVVGLLWWLLHRTLAIGFRSRNSFTLYLCLGIAIVTAVQFVIIALGSTGVIPLTGVAVPFLSYGKVSMILNLLAFGLVLSIATFSPMDDEKSPVAQAERRNMSTYDAPVMVTRVAFLGVALLLLCVFAWFTVVTRNTTLIKPLYVIASNGDAVIQYNPRIAALTRTLKAGNIYDRRGLLLATSDTSLVKPENYVDCGVAAEEVKGVTKLHTRRYYPLGDRLLFMVGDNNSTLNLSYNESNPIGYVAENQHLSWLRGFDNVLYEDKEKGLPKRVNLRSDKYYADPYLPPSQYEKNNVVLRDYSPLLPLLRAGVGSRSVQRVNERKSSVIEPQDIHMTLDAQLQCRLQQGLKEYVRSGKDHLDRKNLLRISVVVLDAERGDMLASALYPQPNQETLEAHANDEYKYYRDNDFGKDQWAYVDRDMGLTYPTQPGSTAKLMSAIAGLRKSGDTAVHQVYNVTPAEQIEPNNLTLGDVSMRTAIVYSSNCYFINLVNDYNLYSELDSVYSYAGVRIEESARENGKKLSVTPYYFRYTPMTNDQLSTWRSIITKKESKAVSYYTNTFLPSRKKGKYLRMGGKGAGVRNDLWGWAWGQGTLSATPLAMARIVSAIVNKGTMPVTRFLLEEPIRGIPLIKSKFANQLKDYIDEMAYCGNGTAFNAIRYKGVGGKTGTPERERQVRYEVGGGETGTPKRERIRTEKHNDGWFIFYVDNCNVPDESGAHKSALAIAVRLERTAKGNGAGSGIVMRLSRDVLLPLLCEVGYHGQFINR